MTHRIEISIKINEKEVQSRSPFSGKIVVKNIGSEPFPGGKFSKLGFKYEKLYSFRTGEAIKIPLLNKDETFNEDITSFAGEKGIVWVEIEITADDGDDVTYFLGEREFKGTWQYPFYVFDNEKTRIFNILKEILNEIKKINNTGDKENE